MKHCLLWSLILLLPLLASSAPLPQMKTLADEIHGGLQRRKLEDRFAGMTTYFHERLDASAGTKTFSDKTGNCRLSWFDWMMRHPVESIGAAEEFTRGLHAAAGQKKGAMASIVKIAAEKLDAPLSAVPPVALPKNISDPGLRILVRALLSARREFDQAMAPLSPIEREELRANLYNQSTGPQAVAPFFADQQGGRRVCDLLEKMDRKALMRAGAALAVLSEPDTLKKLAGTARAQTRGKAMVRVSTPAGDIVFGGMGDNEYKLDEGELANVCAVIDAGGNDTYLEGVLSEKRPLLVTIDLAGNDSYHGGKSGIQGGAILGVSLLVDAAGDDSYTAGDVAQGASLGGFGALIDLAGNDHYKGLRRVQGSTVGGIGLLLDRAGNDDYRASLLAQGVGGPLGFGLLDDLAGNDHYYAGGKEPNTYGDSPGYDGFSQGAGVGPRGSANGGIGCLLDGAGDDIYEADYFSHAAGYWFALGFARDFGGNDQYLGSTRTAYDGGPRKDARFLRWGNCFGCHYAAGYLIDDAGDDSYEGDLAAVGFTWDIGISALVDLAGNDKYKVTSSGLCQCSNGGLSVLYDAAGNDSYQGAGLGTADPTDPYHADPRALNFAFFLDGGGQDNYPKDLKNNADQERGWSGGFFIDKE